MTLAYQLYLYMKHPNTCANVIFSGSNVTFTVNFTDGSPLKNFTVEDNPIEHQFNTVGIKNQMKLCHSIDFSIKLWKLRPGFEPATSGYPYRCSTN